MIELKGITKTYENHTKAIKDISLILPNTGLIAIMGESGSGKSTLLNLLSDNDTPTKGTLLYNNRNYHEIQKQKLTKDFAFIYQDFKLIENMTAYQNIMIGHELAFSNIEYEYVISIAKELGIYEILNQKVYALSGGQMQRVAIARALVRRPKVIFADEPTGNLDTYNSEKVFSILKNLSDKILVVIVTHDDAIRNWANRIITLEDGIIIADEINQPSETMTDFSDEEISENDDIEEILLVLRLKKNKNTNIPKIFKNKEIKKPNRKTERLSGISSLGLSMALLNKDVVKKVFLLIVMIVLIGMMLLAASMTFATPEKTMVKALLKNDYNVFGYQPTIDSKDYDINYNDMKYIDSLFSDNGIHIYEIADSEIINNFWGEITPLISDDIKQSAYYYNVGFQNMNAIFADSGTELGINMLLGKSPVNENEIAISKTYYDYMLYYKKFEVSINNSTHLMEFNKDNILNNKIEPFDVVISGVFDDKNNLDKNLINIDINSLNDEEEINDIQAAISEAHSGNVLIDLILKPTNTYKTWNDFAGVNSIYKLGAKDSVSAIDSFYDYIPLNNATKDYYFLNNYIGDITLNKGEIIIDKATLNFFNNYYNERYSEGSVINLSVYEMARVFNNVFPKTAYDTRSFVIKKVLESDGFQNKIIMYEEDYEEWIIGNKYSIKRLAWSDSISAGKLAKINKEYSSYIQSLDITYLDAFITYSINNCPIKGVAELSFIAISNKYIGVPLMVISVILTIAILLIFYSDIVKTKSKDLLILKSLGAKSSDILSIYGFFSIMLIAIQVVFGWLLGLFLVSLFNIFGSTLSGFGETFAIFYIDIVPISVCFGLIILINAISLRLGLIGINNKNLRKSFQKTKK